MMVSSLQHLGRDVVQTIIQATQNPFTGLFIGLLITAMIQSSSTTTAMVVALVASGSLTLQSAVPIIMGANVGTTITSTIVSLGFISRKKEFRRAVAAGTYHCFFNLLTVVILFPLEYYYEFLSSLSTHIGGYFSTHTSAPLKNQVFHFWSGFSPLIDFLVNTISNGFILIILSFTLLFVSILVFRKLISDLLEAKTPEAFSRFFFKNQLKSFTWGLLTTAAIRSSTITTSVVVPIVAKKITSLKQAAPFIMGANIGTTITAFIAVTLNSNASGAISIAIAHFLFNFIGMLIFFPIPVLRKLPIELANSLGRLTLKYRLAGFVFILLTFFFIPFSLIYFNQESLKTMHITYKHIEGDDVNYFRIIARTNTRNNSGEWMKFEGEQKHTNEEPSMIFPVYVKNKSLFVGDQIFLLNKPGFCWDGEDTKGKYRACIEEVLPKLEIAGFSFDSVFVCNLHYMEAGQDSLKNRVYVAAEDKIIVKRQLSDNRDSVIFTEEVTRFERH
ncbi:Na/Pi symporter [Fulvivirgaceae bacterium PWU20]|uniref:Na/Pi symporter n=2 Tax=Chryseosolibacter indicus TaxID=2782351 RepID=A0ABS5VZ02_9BACT|nr:Na/Pi symporter [Chryseosolibacter indicus]